MKSFFSVAAALTLAASPASAEKLEYRVLIQSQDIGHLIVDRSSSTIMVDYDYKQNGRGPTIKERLELDSSGAPRNWSIQGRTTFDNPVDESFRRNAAGVQWRDLAGLGSIRGGAAPRYYVTQNGSPLDAALLAKALLRTPGNRLDVAPTGTATLTEKDRRFIDGAGGRIEIVTYELAGLSLLPGYITLDTRGEFFSLQSSGFIVARAGYEKQADAPLRELAERLASERLAGLQAAHAHRFAVPVRLRNVRIFDPVSRTLTPSSDVVWSAGRITEVVAAGSAQTADEKIIEGAGGTLIPGLYDMHAHLDQSDALLNVLAGVTSVRDMGNRNDVLDVLARRIESGEVAGPRITRNGFVEGKSPFSSISGRLASGEAEAVDAVRWYAARGYRQVKIYNSIKPEWVPAIVREARAKGMTVAGHIPAFSNADAMIAAGYNEITHINQAMLGWVLKPDEDTRTLLRLKAMQRFPSVDLQSAAVRATLDAMVAQRVAVEPTLGIVELGLTAVDGQPNPGALDYIDHLPPAEHRNLKQAMLGAESPAERARFVTAYSKVLETVAEMHRRGILLIPGTDLGGAFTLHRELELFTRIGMSPAEVLTRATLDMARYLGQDQSLGSIERGKYADFFLVPGDPTRDLKAIKSIAMVVRGGTVYFPAELYAKLGIKPFAAAPPVR